MQGGENLKLDKFPHHTGYWTLNEDRAIRGEQKQVFTKDLTFYVNALADVYVVCNVNG